MHASFSLGAYCTMLSARRALLTGLCALAQVYPKNTNLKCTFTAWAPVCQYILSQLTVDPSSEWRKNGICIPTST